MTELVRATHRFIPTAQLPANHAERPRGAIGPTGLLWERACTKRRRSMTAHAHNNDL